MLRLYPNIFQFVERRRLFQHLEQPPVTQDDPENMGNTTNQELEALRQGMFVNIQRGEDTEISPGQIGTVVLQLSKGVPIKLDLWTKERTFDDIVPKEGSNRIVLQPAGAEKAKITVKIHITNDCLVVVLAGKKKDEMLVIFHKKVSAQDYPEFEFNPTDRLEIFLFPHEDSISKTFLSSEEEFTLAGGHSASEIKDMRTTPLPRILGEGFAKLLFQIKK